MNRWVEITFDCVPLRSVMRLDAPLDASPKYRELLGRVKAAIQKHGLHNSYYLHNALCTYRLVNSQEIGMLQFAFEGVLLTDAEDRHAQSCDLRVDMVRETCDWLTEPVVRWFAETVPRSVAREFDRYIEAGDLARTKQRIEMTEASSDQAGGFFAMYL